jgi:hypothetical protein
MAHLMLDSLDGAAHQVTTVLELPPEMRIGTVTGYLESLDQMLSQPRLRAAAWRLRCGSILPAEFNSAAAA